MWKLRKISLLDGAAPQGELLRAEQLQMQQQAAEVLAQAQQRAEKIIAAAQQQADEHIAEQRLQWEAQFWQQADTLLSGWHQQRQQDEQQLVSLATQLLNQAMTQLLGEFSDEQRFHALLQQLLRQHSRQQQATLWCASSHYATVSAWLAQQSQLAWQLSSDEQLPDDQLRLVTEHGELQVSWSMLCQQLALTPST